MKKFLLSLTVLSTLLFTACEKCADCECVGNWEYEFDANIDQASRTAIINAYNNEFSTDYGAKSDEICEKGKKNLDEAMDNYEDSNSEVIQDGSNVGGYEWSVVGDFTCTCTEQ